MRKVKVKWSHAYRWWVSCCEKNTRDRTERKSKKKKLDKGKNIPICSLLKAFRGEHYVFFSHGVLQLDCQTERLWTFSHQSCLLLLKPTLLRFPQESGFVWAGVNTAIELGCKSKQADWDLLCPLTNSSKQTLVRFICGMNGIRPWADVIAAIIVRCWSAPATIAFAELCNMGFIIVVIALLLWWYVPHLCSPALRSWQRAAHLPCMTHTWHTVHETPKCLPQFWRGANLAGPFWITWHNWEENTLSFLGPQKPHNLWQWTGDSSRVGFCWWIQVRLTFCLCEIKPSTPPSHQLIRTRVNELGVKTLYGPNRSHLFTKYRGKCLLTACNFSTLNLQEVLSYRFVLSMFAQYNEQHTSPSLC